MEVNNLATEDVVDQLLPKVADEKIEGRRFGCSARPILAGLGVCAMVAVVINYRPGDDLGIVDAGGLQELAEWLPWKEGEGKEKKFYLNADNRAGSWGTPKNYQACVALPQWTCNHEVYDKFPCAAPSLSSWSMSSAGWYKDRQDQCNSNAACSGFAGWDDGAAWKKVWTMKAGKTRLTEKSVWTTCLKKRLKCGDGYTEYQSSMPSWCHSTYSPISLASGNAEKQVKEKCDADPGCTGYTHMTDQSNIYLVNNHAQRTERGHKLKRNKWWKSCMKIEGLNRNWHSWCW